MAQQSRNVAWRVLGWLIALGVVVTPMAYLTLHEEAIDVTATPVTRGNVEDTITSISAGTVTAREDAMIAASLLGIIVSVPEEGQRLEAGDLLVELDHDELDAQVALTEANLRAGRSRLEQAKLAAVIYAEICATQVSQTAAQRDLARAEYDRIRRLSEQRAVSESDLDKAAAALRVAEETHAAALAGQKENLVRQEEVRAAEAAIEQLEAAGAAARAGRDRALVRAPFPGVVGRRLLDVGEATALGSPILHFVRDDDCHVRAPFDEANAAEICLGQEARLNLDAYRGVDFAGEVVYVSPVVSLNPDLSRTLDVKVRIDEGRDRFVPGMSVDVTLIADEKHDVVRVPSEALVREEFAYIVEEGRAVRRTVETGVGNWNMVEVVDGLAEGETLITSVSASGLEDGVRVVVVEALE